MSEPQGLCVVWSSADPDVAKSMVFMYTHNSKLEGWWDKVRLIVWGASSKMLVQNMELQQAIKEMQEDGVEIWACRACSDMHGVTEELEALGIDVKYTGVPLTEMLKTGWATLTF